MDFAGISYLAIVIAAAVGFIFGGVYYRTLSAQWLAASGVRKEDVQGHPWGLYATAIVANLVMAWALAGILGHLGPGQVTVWNGLVSAFFVWLGFVATTIAVNNGFGMRPPMLSIIDAGHWLGVLLIMGAIIGAFGV